MVTDQDANAAVPQPRHDRLNIVNGDRVNAGEGLIQHHELRMRHECARDFEPTSFATGQAVGLVASQVLDAQLVQQLF